MVQGTPDVFFSPGALKDLDRITQMTRNDGILTSLLPSGLPLHAVYAGATRILFDRWRAVVDGVEVTYDVLTSEKIMVIALRAA